VQRVETGQFDLPLFSFLVPPNSGTGTGSIIDERVYFDAVRGCLACWDVNGRNALTSVSTVANGTHIFEQSSGRTFRWNATNSRWDYINGPWYTWTPTLVDTSNNAVTYGGSGSARGTYIIYEGRIRFTCSFLFKDPIDGKTGALRLQMPSGVVSKTTEPLQYVHCSLYTAVSASHWSGTGQVAANTTLVQPYFPISVTNGAMGALINATSAGATNTGTPQVSSYPLTDGSRFACWGDYELSSWPAL
jgi:hypothetical protein